MTDLVPVNAPTRVRELCSRLQLEVETFADNGAEISMQIMDRILSAAEGNGTPEEIAAAIFEANSAGSVAGQDYVGKPFRLREDGISVRASGDEYTEQGAFPFFLLLNATDLESGKDIVLNCGGRNIVASLIAFRDAGVLAHYEKDGGMPLVFNEKAASVGKVLFLQPYDGKLLNRRATKA